MALQLTNIDIFKSHIGGLQSKISQSVVEPFLLISERWFRSKIGATLFDIVKGLSDDDEIKTFSTGAICWYAFSKAQPHLHVKIGDLGSAKNLPHNMVALTKWEYVKLEESALSMIDVFLEGFWMAVDAEAIEGYTNSDDAIKRRSNLIQTATEFTSFFPLVRGSVRMFEEFSIYLKKAERYYVSDVITQEVFSTLITKVKSGNELSENESELLPICKEVVASYGLLMGLNYIQLVVDTEGIRVVEKSDSTRNELVADTKRIDKLRLDIKAEAELAVGKLREFMNTNATDVEFSSYYNVFLKPLPPTPIDLRAYPIL